MSTGVTPFFADLGRHPKYLPKRLNHQGTEVPASAIYLEQRKQAEQETKAAINLANREHKEFYDKHVSPDPTYKPGDQVWLSKKDPHTTLRPAQKLEHRRFGPFKVVKAIGTKAYQLDLPNTMKIHPVFHVSRLMQHQPDPSPGQITSPPPPIETEQGEEYEVELILDSRWKKGRGKPRFQYLIAWKGYGPSDNSWSDLIDVTSAPDTIAKFHSTNPNAAHPTHPSIDRQAKTRATVKTTKAKRHPKTDNSNPA